MNKVLISSVLATLLLVACGDDKKTVQDTVGKVEAKVQEKSSVDKIKEATSDISNTVSKASSEVADTVSKAGSEVMEKSKDVIKNVSDTVSKEVKEKSADIVEKTADVVKDVKETTKEVVDKTVEKTTEVVNDVKETTKKALDKTVEKTTDVVKDVKETTSNVVASTVASVSKSSSNGETLYKACSSCHGQKAEKKALGKSEIIAGWDKQKTIDALNGYKNGTYGGAMKAVMKGQVASKSEADIVALAEYISTMK